MLNMAKHPSELMLGVKAHDVETQAKAAPGRERGSAHLKGGQCQPDLIFATVAEEPNEASSLHISTLTLWLCLALQPPLRVLVDFQ